MIKKLHFTKQNEEQEVKVPLSKSVAEDTLFIRTIEVKTPNPSELTLVYKGVEFMTPVIIGSVDLADYRTKFIFQNGVYILDTKNIPAFSVKNDFIRISLLFAMVDTSIPIDVDVFYILKPVQVPQAIS